DDPARPRNPGEDVAAVIASGKKPSQRVKRGHRCIIARERSACTELQRCGCRIVRARIAFQTRTSYAAIHDQAKLDCQTRSPGAKGDDSAVHESRHHLTKELLPPLRPHALGDLDATLRA